MDSFAALAMTLVSLNAYAGCATCEAGKTEEYRYYGTSVQEPAAPVPIPASTPQSCNFKKPSHHKCHVIKKQQPVKQLKKRSFYAYTACSCCDEKHTNCTERKSACKKETCSIETSKCPSFPIRKMNCKIINPADIVDFTCDRFSEKLDNNEPYTCQAPYAQDPTIRTTWKIIGKKGDRCVVSSITEFVGFKDKDDNSMPLTQTCEYDELGKKGLIERMNDVEKRSYHSSTCDRFEGIHNCVFTSSGQPIHPRKIVAPHDEEIDFPIFEH